GGLPGGAAHAQAGVRRLSARGVLRRLLRAGRGAGAAVAHQHRRSAAGGGENGRVQRVAITRLCNQNCAFCTERAATDDSFAVKAALEEARGAEEILLSGGEPTLRRDLPGIVAYAKRSGARV